MQSNTLPCGIYIVTPEEMVYKDLMFDLSHMFMAINDTHYEINNHVLEFRPTGRKVKSYYQFAQTLGEFCRANGIVFVLHGDYRLAHTLKADGVLLSRTEDVVLARELLAKRQIIGLQIAATKVAAERAMKLGVDYISVDKPTPEFVAWWASHSEIPCVVEGKTQLAQLRMAVQAGATMVEAGKYIFAHKKGVEYATYRVMDVIKEADSKGHLH